MGEQGKWQLAERFFRELEAEQLEMMAKEAAAADVAASRRQLAAAMDGAAAGASGPESAALLAATQWLQAAAAAPAQGPAVSAFPGMNKQLPTGTAAASDAVGSNPEAIAAAAAAVAAMAAAHQQQQQLAAAAAAAAEEDSDGLGLVAARAAEQVLATPRSSMSVEVGSPASTSSADSAAAPFFSYFSGAAAAKPAGGSFVQPAEASSPSSVTDAAFASAFGPQHQQAAAAAAAASGQPAAAWTNDNAAVRGLSFHLDDVQGAPAAPPLPAAAVAGNAVPAAGLTILRPLPKGRGPVNEVVCGALMLAYERAGKWQEAVAVLDRARTLGEWTRAAGEAEWAACMHPELAGIVWDVHPAELSSGSELPTGLTSCAAPLPCPLAGIAPNTIMFNTAMSALGKAMRPEEAEALFAEMPAPDAVSAGAILRLNVFCCLEMLGVDEAAEKLLFRRQRWRVLPGASVQLSSELAQRPRNCARTCVLTLCHPASPHASPAGVVRDADCRLWHERAGRQGRGRL